MTDGLNTAELSDEQIDERLAALDADDPGDDTATDDQGEAAEEADAEPPADGQAEGEQDEHPEGFDPEGPGNLKAALKEAREKLKATNAEREAERQQLQQLMAWRQQQEAQQQAALHQYEESQRAELRRQQWENTFDDDERLRLQEAWRAEDAQRIQSQATQQYVDSLYRQTWQMASQTIPDFVETMADKMADPSMRAALEAAAYAAVQQGQSPAFAAYQLAKQFRTDADIEAEVEKRLSARLQAVLQKNQTPATAGVKSIAALGSEKPGAPVMKDPRRMSDAELNSRLRGD